MNRMNRNLIRFLLAGCMSALTPTATRAADTAQELGDMVFAAGTVAADSHGRDWAYLSWLASDTSMLIGQQYEIYAKSGAAGSSNPYTFKGRAQLQTDPNSISALAARSVNLGQDLTQLESAIDQLFAEALPSSSISLGEKIAAVINGSVDDTEMYRNMIFLSQVHPALALAIGRAYACPIPAGLSTFEIRDHHSSEVVGRVTVEAGHPVVLPAPANIVQVFDTSAKGHLNIRLRWEAPDALRRLSLMQFGYNIYRIDKAFAEDPSRRFDLTPPGTAQLLALESSAPEVKRVNPSPILADVDNVTPDTFFFADDNDGLSGGIPFIDGDQYYYFVTALDLLGRDGLVSPGYLAIACDRVPPPVPKDIRTRELYDYSGGSPVQAVEISWDQDPDLAETAKYFLYRHPSISNMQANASNPTVNLIAGPILPIPGAERLAYTNTMTLADQDKTYWYTLRAADDAACGANLSLNSAPVYGGIHDWEGPEAPVNSGIRIFSETLTTTFESVRALTNTTFGNVELSCSRNNDRIKWAEFAYFPNEVAGSSGSFSNAVTLGRFYFDTGSNNVATTTSINAYKGRQITFLCRVGNGLHKSSIGWIVQTFEAPLKCAFKGEAAYAYRTAPGHGPHILIPGTPAFPVISADVPAGAGEYRFYRRVDGGPRTLIAQGATSNATTIIEQDKLAGILNGGSICYYYQFNDFNGNPGPMTRIDCIDVARTIELPRPDLLPIKSTGTETNNPGMKVRWFCPPPGVERFEVALHMDQGTYPTSLSTSLRDISDDGLTNTLQAVSEGQTNSLGFVSYRTGRVGADFSAVDEATFVFSAGIDLNTEYTLMVRALGPNGELGPWSDSQTFEWHTVPAATGPQVPWPARGLPPVQAGATFNTNLTAEIISIQLARGELPLRVGVRIGEIPYAEFSDQGHGTIYLTSSVDPQTYLYENLQYPGETAFPCVMYRYQVPSFYFPTVSGDVAQVSVLMKEMAWGQSKGATTIYDPFVYAYRKSGNDLDPWGLYLLDTHPVVSGAAYRYLLVHFNTNGEPDRTIDAGTVLIP